ncbi:single-stranded-DNA-specific exonuclease RecJ [Nitratifractor sp.]
MENARPLLDLSRIEALLKARFDKSFLTLKDLPDPYAFKDMERAVERIVTAIGRGEKILLVGDYDVDGVSATAIMRRFFSKIDVPLEWVIPNRFRDGYGLSPTLFPRLSHADLIITVDNGIAAHEAAALCKAAGIDLIITDHHIVSQTPPEAYAIVDQKQKECSFPHAEVCGAQIAWYLCAALNRRLGAGVDMKALLELAAPAIIADIMPLLHINRAMVEQGLKLLERSGSPFIVAWKEMTGNEELRAEDIAFGLAPLLNSAGRMEDASEACDFLCSEDLHTARRLLLRLQGYNERRKSLENEIAREAMEKADEKAPVLVVAGEAWHEGVLGIVAARLARRYERPALVLTRSGENEYKGSGRSFGTCDLFSLVESQRKLLERFGGHRAAVGLSLAPERLEEFRIGLEREALALCPAGSFQDPDILGEVPLGLVDWNLYNLLERFEPYGEGNPRPKFVSRRLEVLEHRALSGGLHHRYRLGDGETVLEAIHFRSDAFVGPGNHVDVLFTLGSNTFNGRKNLQLMIEKIVEL